MFYKEKKNISIAKLSITFIVGWWNYKTFIKIFKYFYISNCKFNFTYECRWDTKTIVFDGYYGVC